ncbi:hypothetical protein KAR91_38630 [Candidatus Pacearchaeota archaeon]|nr:hypothetical protein [Candidatus Pacearchaeota archaeon]
MIYRKVLKALIILAILLAAVMYGTGFVPATLALLATGFGGCMAYEISTVKEQTAPGLT